MHLQEMNNAKLLSVALTLLQQQKTSKHDWEKDTISVIDILYELRDRSSFKAVSNQGGAVNG